MHHGAGAGGTGLSIGNQKGGNVQNKLLMKMQEKSKDIDMVFSRYNVKIILSVLLKEGLSRMACLLNRLRRTFINPFNIILFILGIISLVTDVFLVSTFG